MAKKNGIPAANRQVLSRYSGQLTTYLFLAATLVGSNLFKAGWLYIAERQQVLCSFCVIDVYGSIKASRDPAKPAFNDRVTGKHNGYINV